MNKGPSQLREASPGAAFAAGQGELGALKLTALVVLYMLVFVILPGAWADVERAPPGTRGFTVLLAVLFVSGVVMAGVEMARTGVDRHSPLPRPGGVALGLLTGVLLVQAVYITVAGPTPPILAASMGYDALQVALLREEAVKLNGDPTFVRMYVWARDIVGPIAFMLGIQALVHARAQRQRWIALLALATSVYVAIWSSQKATLVNYALAALIFIAHDARHLLRLSIRAVPLIALLVFGLFLFTYAGFFDADVAGADGVLSSVVSGLVERVFVGPLEVSMAYVDAVDNAHLIDAVDVIPVIGAWLHPGRDTVENIIGQHYFYSGIDSISANAMSFAYAYIIGGPVMVVLSGAVTVVALVGLQVLVRSTRSPFASYGYSAMCCYLLLDLLAGNVFSYLVSAVEWGVIAFIAGSLAPAIQRRLGRAPSTAMSR